MAKFRHLVPALGLMALIPAAMAADTAPAAPSVTFSGWVDSVFSISDTRHDEDNGATAKVESGYSARFIGAASLKAAWKVGDKVTGKINLWLDDSNSSAANVREAYFTYQVTDTIGLQGGKYIDHIGWISAEPTGLYLVNGSIIGYTANTYGNDVLGAAAIITPKDSPIVGQLHVTNGYYTGSDANSVAYSSAPSENRNNHDMGWGFDLTYTVNDKVSLNLEGAYDTHSGYNARSSSAAGVDSTGTPFAASDVSDLGGNVAYIGLNATIKPTSDLLIGAEIQALNAGTGRNAAGQEVGSSQAVYQGMLLANYVLPGTPFPMSVTLSDQYVDKIKQEQTGAIILQDDGVNIPGGKIRSNAVQAALLTNPTGSTNFGVNLEVGYWQTITEDTQNDVAGNKSNTSGWETALEALVTF